MQRAFLRPLVGAPTSSWGRPSVWLLHSALIASPQRQETLAQAALTVGHAATVYEIHKRRHLRIEDDCRQQGILFVPLVAEASGGWDPPLSRPSQSWPGWRPAGASPPTARRLSCLSSLSDCQSQSVRPRRALSFGGAAAFLSRRVKPSRPLRRSWLAIERSLRSAGGTRFCGRARFLGAL